MKYRHFLAVYLITVFICNVQIQSQTKAQWTICTGEALVQNISNEEAQVIAKRKARLDAIEKVCGVQLQAESLVRNFMLAGDFIHSIAYGHVVEEKDIRWQTELIPPEDPSVPPVIKLIVTMNAKVKPVQEKPDPSFKVNLTLNRTSFDSGDEVIFTISFTQDCYITIINLAANDSVYVLFPNTYHKDNMISSKEKFTFPSRSDRESGFYIRVAALPEHKKDTEIVKVIATKKKVDFLFGLNMTEGFGLMGTPKMAITQLARHLSEIPVSERAEATEMYTVYNENN